MDYEQAYKNLIKAIKDNTEYVNIGRHHYEPNYIPMIQLEHIKKEMEAVIHIK